MTILEGEAMKFDNSFIPLYIWLCIGNICHVSVILGKYNLWQFVIKFLSLAISLFEKALYKSL